MVKLSLSIPLIGFALSSGVPASASPTVTPESALTQFCEPLIDGSTAAAVTNAAKEAGFKSDQVGGNPVLVSGELILGVSDAPRACIIQAPAGMTFEQGVALVDAWAARHTGAKRGAATKGPDGAPVRLWAVPSEKRYLLVSEQANPRGQKVLNFLMAPLPAA